MAYHFSQQHRVQFADTDAAGIMHFSAFFRYMEETEHAFYRSLGFSVFGNEHDENGKGGWPRLNTSCEYQHPLRFEEVFEVQVTIEKLEEKTIDYRFDFVKDGKTIATGRFGIIYAVKPNNGGPMKATAIPERFAAKLREAMK